MECIQAISVWVEQAKSVWESKTGNINMGILTRDICIEILKDNINLAAEFSM